MSGCGLVALFALGCAGDPVRRAQNQASASAHVHAPTESHPGDEVWAELPKLSALELAALERGEAVTRPISVEDTSGEHIGGLGYQLVPGTVDDIFNALSRVETLGQVLPRTYRAEVVAEEDGAVYVELEQGNGWVRAVYTIAMHTVEGRSEAGHTELGPRSVGEGTALAVDTARTSREVRFWLEPTRPHDIDDVWGFFRIEAFDNEQSLVTTGALVDLGSDFLQYFFKERVEGAILATPARVRQVLAARER
jgi:hypothetical protein